MLTAPGLWDIIRKKQKGKMQNPLTKIYMLKEIMLFRQSLKPSDPGYIDPRNLEFVNYISKEYKKMRKDEIQIDYDYYFKKAHA